jgi:acetoacetyl-CoA synthetase
MAGQRAGARPAAGCDLTALRSILQTGSPLPAAAWEWTYRDVKPEVWLQSVCGGTDVCSALAGGTPLLPVYPGRIQAPALGVALAAWDGRGNPVHGEEGELVVTAPMPSMPLYFWNDPGGVRYHDSYFGMFPGVWRHGDWVTVNGDGSIVVSGRSDATLNRMGVRMGSADIYAVVEELPEIADSLVIGTELGDGGYFMPLFVVTAPGTVLDDALRSRISRHVRTQLSPRHVPDAIVEVPAIPRTLTGKKLEIPVKRIIQGGPAGEVTGVTHPEMLAWFARYAAGLGL